MDQATLYWVVGIATIVAAAAIVLQLAVLFSMAVATWQTKKRATALMDKIEPAIDVGQRLLDEVRSTAGDLSTKATEMMDLSRKQLVRIDELLGEATGRTRVQMDRVELVLDDVMNRFQETTATVQEGILKPVRQIAGVAAGIRAALSALGARRTSVEQATHDEEMFI